jgi:hypothetical protein
MEIKLAHTILVLSQTQKALLKIYFGKTAK